jgi:hypothetical protein
LIWLKVLQVVVVVCIATKIARITINKLCE